METNQTKYLAELYVELTTRKLFLEFNEDSDCIYEIYNSWFRFFSWCREQMKKIAKEYPDILMFIHKEPMDYSLTNDGVKYQNAYIMYSEAMNIIRHHLEKYSYDFRVWWEAESVNDSFGNAVVYKSLPDKESQNQNEFYSEIVLDIVGINQKYKILVTNIINEIKKG